MNQLGRHTPRVMPLQREERVVGAFLFWLCEFRQPVLLLSVRRSAALHEMQPQKSRISFLSIVPRISSSGEEWREPFLWTWEEVGT